MDFTINYLAVIFSTIYMMILGFLWYGPLFGKAWMKELGFTKESIEKEKKKGMTKSYILMGISAFIMSYVVAHILIAFNSNSILMAIQGGFWMWLGFIATVLLGKVLWEGKTWKLYSIDSGYYLVGLVGISIILTLWR